MRSWAMLSWSRTLAHSALGLSLLGATACRKQEAHDAETPIVLGDPLPAASGDLQAQLAALGDRGVVVVVVRDAGFAEGVATLNQLLGARGSKLYTPISMFAELGAIVDVPIRDSELTGRDTSRPILASLLEAPIDGPITAATALQPLRDGVQLGLREQIVIPATDVATLMNSIADQLGELAAWPELVAGHSNARAWKLDGGFVAALPEGSTIRVVVVHDATGLDPIVDLPRWQAQLDRVEVATLDTPALRQLGQPEHTLALWFRPWRVRAFGAWEGLRQGHWALRDAPVDLREHAIGYATAIVLGGELMAPDDDPELDDWAITVSPIDGALRVRAVASLTALGERIWAAGREQASPRLRVTATDVDTEAWFAVDLEAMIAAAPKSGAVEGLSSAEALELWRNCGWTCPIHASTRMPFGALRTILGGAPSASLAQRLATQRSTGVHYVELAPDPDGRPRRALALLLSPGASVDHEPIAELIREELGTELSSSVVLVDGTPVLVFAEGVEPSAVFDLSALAEPSAAVVGGRARVPGFNSPASLRVSPAGPALAIELTIGGEPSSFAPDFTSLRWASPQRSAAPSPGDPCLAKAGLAVTRTLTDQRTTVPGQWAGTAVAALAKIEPELGCASEHPSTAAAAAGLRRLLFAGAVMDRLAVLEFDPAAQLLDGECDRSGDAWACARKATLAAGPKPALVQVDAGAIGRCGGGAGEYEWPIQRVDGLPLLVSADGIALDGRPLAADARVIAAAIVEQLDDDAIDDRSLDGTPISLVVDAKLEFAELAPVLEALAALDYRRVALMVRDRDGQLHGLPLGLALEKRFDVALPEREHPRPDDDEPPPEDDDEPPVEGDDGGDDEPRRAKPKTGLYDMLGPKDAVPQMDRGGGDSALVVTIEPGRLSATPPDGVGKRVVVGDLAGLAEATDAWRVDLRVAAKTPWAEVVGVAIGACPLSVTLVDE